MLDRRRFLVGAGGLITTAFVRKATAFYRSAGQPVVLPSAKPPEETLYVYSPDWVEPPYGKWRVPLGPNQPVAPPPPSWREYLRSRGDRLDSEEDIERVCSRNGLTLEELDNAVNGFGWEDICDNFTSPQAKAYHLLKEIDLGGADSELKQAGQIIFEGCGAPLVSLTLWVDLKDDLTVSLLQARLIELNLPINVKVGGPL